MTEKNVKHELAIVGPKDAIQGFKALGIIPHSARTVEEVTETLYRLKEEKIQVGTESKPKYAVIFVFENLAEKIARDDYNKLSEEALPAIIPIPGVHGSTGFGNTRLSQMVEQAVGSDIFGDK